MRRGGLKWIEDGVFRCSSRASIWCPSRGGTVAESLVGRRSTLTSVPWLGAKGSSIVDDPEEFLRKLIPDQRLFSSYKQATFDSGGVFQGRTGLWMAEYWLARQLHRLKASNAMDHHTTFFVISA